MTPDEERVLFEHNVRGIFFLTYGWLDPNEKHMVAKHKLTPVFYHDSKDNPNATFTEADVYAGLIAGKFTTTETGT